MRQTKIGLATASMVMSLTLSACGTQGAEPRPPHDTTSAAQTEPLSQTDLDRAALTAADVQGYEVQRAVASPAVSRKTAEPASCAPVMHAVGGSSGAAATARIARHVFPKEHGAPSAQLTLSSYDLPTARAVMEDLRTSAKACATYKDVLVDFTYKDVNLGPSPSYGDESLSLTLTQLASTGPSDPPVRVPYAVVAVREGTTVAMFTTFTHSGGDGASGPAAVPEAIVEAQVGKLADGG
ncbi:hypothetical protein [Streptomyces griseosporeus]|uniref:hypothetical protein n=1 Tax=Streptomyces griseosporeus TaxID=1910 RepID=UPI0037019CA5